MRLNPDCMRDVLLVAEDNVPLNGSLSMGNLLSLLPSYSKDELTYTCLKLNEGNLLNVLKMNSDNATSVANISDITYEGHQFLENIRNQSTWETVKQKLSLLGSSSVPVIVSVASQLMIEKIKSSL
nr:MAG TPA: multiple antibiotic resistance protein MarR/DNA family protein, HTH motif.67A [Caudoviricetes sp.]